MGCAVEAHACPAILYRDVEDWGLPDPEGLSIEGVRTVWDEVRRKVVELVCALEATKQAR